jgi:aminoglycoside phosphotransferase family enzyme
MTSEQIHELLQELQTQSATLIETHISWVLLLPEEVFKIKKPVKFDFLDFSTPELRRFYCEEELRLNRRLAPQMYLDMVSIGLRDGHWRFGAEPALDYAVHMRRMDNTLQMDHLLAQNRVKPGQMRDLATLLAGFHQQNRLQGAIRYNPGGVWNDFADLFQHHDLIEQYISREAAQLLNSRRQPLEDLLRSFDDRLLERALEGFWIEGHGDLHSRNIFLTDPPTVFDCIEFSEHFRQMDVLNELAFLCMDLEFFGRSDLAEAFLTHYRRQWEVLPDQADRQLFLYFKAYRANVRLKVLLLQLQASDGAAPEARKNAQRYWGLLGCWAVRLLGC